MAALLQKLLAGQPLWHHPVRSRWQCGSILLSNPRKPSSLRLSTVQKASISSRKCLPPIHKLNACSYRASWTEIDLTQPPSEEMSQKNNISVKGIFNDADDDSATASLSGKEGPAVTCVETVSQDIDNNLSLNEKIELVLIDPKRRSVKVLFGKLMDVIMEHLNACSHPLTYEEWQLAADHLSDPKYYYHKFWYGSVLKTLITCGNEYAIGHAQSLIDYVRTVQGKLTAPLLLLFLGVLGRFGSRNDQPVIYSILEELRSITDVVEPKSSIWLISALCRTDRWMESFAIIDELSDDLPVLGRHLSPVAVAAFSNNAPETGWNIVAQLQKQNEQLLEGAIVDLWQLAMPDRKIGTQLLMEMRNGQWIPAKSVVQTIAGWFESDPDTKWQSTMTTVRQRTCQNCQQLLEPIWDISQTDFTRLRESFLEKSLKKTDIYQTSHPQELSEFQGFLQQCQPYDIVIDGLNVAWLNSYRVSQELVISVIEELRQKHGFRVLMIGRKHMKKWHYFERNTRSIAQCFYMDDDTKDDPFMVLAALHQGPGTYILTRDEFRDHSFLLGPELQQLFHHWQRGHRFKIHPKYNTFALEGPQQFERRVQQSATGWHIPYHNGPRDKTSSKFLCVMKKT